MGAAAVESSEPEHELTELERLGQIVVGAELETGSLVIEPVGRGEHEDGHAAVGGDDAPGDLVARGPGDISVKDRDVVGVDAEQCRAVPPSAAMSAAIASRRKPSRMASAM